MAICWRLRRPPRAGDCRPPLRLLPAGTAPNWSPPQAGDRARLVAWPVLGGCGRRGSGGGCLGGGDGGEMRTAGFADLRRLPAAGQAGLLAVVTVGAPARRAVAQLSCRHRPISAKVAPWCRAGLISVILRWAVTGANSVPGEAPRGRARSGDPGASVGLGGRSGRAADGPHSSALCRPMGGSRPWAASFSAQRASWGPAAPHPVEKPGPTALGPHLPSPRAHGLFSLDP